MLAQIFVQDNKRDQSHSLSLDIHTFNLKKKGKNSHQLMFKLIFSATN